MKVCKWCGRTEKECKIINHHVSYEKNIIIDLCISCHFKVHRQKDHPFYPVDKLMSKPLTRKLIIFRKQGRVTVPAHLLQMQKWDSGDEIEFRVNRDEIILRKVRT